MNDIAQHHRYMARRKWSRLGAIGAAIAAGLLFYQYTSHQTAVSRLDTADLDEVARIADRNPYDRAIQIATAKREMDEGNTAQAHERMRLLAQHQPNDFDVQLGLAQAAAMDGSASQAIEAYRKAIALNPREFKSYVMLARIYFDAHLYSDALAVFEQLRAINREKLEGDIVYGECLVRLGKLREGMEQLMRAIRILPLQDAAFPPMTDAAIKLGRQAEVLDLIQWRLEKQNIYPFGDVRSSAARLILSQHPAADQLRTAEEQARAALGDPRPAYYAVYARVLEAKGKWKAALDAAKAGVKMDPRDRECLAIEAEVAEHLGQGSIAQAARATLAKLDQSERDVRSVEARIQAKPEDRQGYLALAATLDKKGMPARAAETLQQLLQKHPGDAEASSLLTSYRDRAISKLQTVTAQSIDDPSQPSPAG